MGIRLRALIFCALLFTDILSQYWNGVSSLFLGCVAALAWITALPAADKVSRNISLILGSVGLVLFVYNRVPLEVVMSSFGENIGVLMVMTLVPLMGTVIELGEYNDALRAISKRVKSPTALFVFSLVLVYLIGSVLLTTAIALVWMVLVPAVLQVGKKPAEFLSDCLPRGYDASLLWTPVSPSMAATLSATRTPWPSVFAPGLVLSLGVLISAVVTELGTPQLKRRPEADRVVADPSTPVAGVTGATEGCVCGGTASGAATSNRVADPTAASDMVVSTMANPERRVAELAIGLLSFIVAAASLNLSGLTVYQSMVPCVLIGVLIWAAYLRKLPQACRAIIPFFAKRVPGLSNQFVLMIIAGFLGRAVQIACKNTRFSFLSGLPNLGPIGFSLVVSLLVWGSAMVGIHPIIGTSIVYSIVSPYAGRFSGLPMTLALLLGSCLGFSISPISATILITSSCAGGNTVDVGLKKHWKFVLLSWVVCSACVPFVVPC
ncbi:MAG TPA: hypothetical protein GXX40_01960 [Firmicutes bacterium]|nr:hypothetical protein [Bacillota bacterium]